MKEKKIFDAITEVHEDYIEEASTIKLKKHSFGWKRWTAVAACVVLVLGIVGISFIKYLPFGGNSATGGGGAGHGESRSFMSYAGPIFPMTLGEEDSDISATRNISYDFSLANDEDLRVWGSKVTDSYSLHNSSAVDKTITAIYPFVGSFRDLSKRIPSITTNGQEISPTLYAGGYSGGFTSAIEDETGSLNPLKLDSWEGFKTLLQSGEYQASAFEDAPLLTQNVTVYTFTDFLAPTKEFPAATQAISFTIDPKKTKILSFGFNGLEIDDNGFRRYSYFVPNEARAERETILMVVIGDDIKDYTLKGYKNGACERGNELEGVSVTIIRTENILSEVLNTMIDNFFKLYDDGDNLTISKEIFLDSVSKFMLSYVMNLDKVIDRYQWERMDDIISDMLAFERVFYLEYKIHIPAGDTVTVAASMHKNPSYDYACAGTENAGIQGYDLVTELGSNLNFQEQTAELTNTDLIEIVRQNYGFDIDNDVKRVTLDPSNEHYYLEIRTLDKRE